MNSKIDRLLIIAYLNGSLTGEKKEAFEQELARNEALRSELSLYQEINQTLEDKELRKFSTQVLAASEDHFNALSSTRKRPFLAPRMAISIAASFIVLLFAAYWIWFRTPSLDHQGLYAEYAQHDYSISERQSESELNRAEQLLKSGEFAQAIPILKNYLEKEEDAADVQLLLGIAWLELDSTDAAATTFRQLKTAHPLFANEASWYLSLTHLKKNNLDSAIINLNTINSKSSRYNDSQDLIKAINTLRK